MSKYTPPTPDYTFPKLIGIVGVPCTVGYTVTDGCVFDVSAVNETGLEISCYMSKEDYANLEMECYSNFLARELAERYQIGIDEGETLFGEKE